MALARSPVAGAQQPAFARHLVRTTCALIRPPAKCLVLDLDNTLWGGVIGDDGLEGIQLSDDHPGVAYKSFQRAVLALRDRGILLAIASKNDPQPVEQAFREHPEMLIRWEDLAARRIGWGPKSFALREIATELNLGADSLVFFDDDPVERAEVRLGAPEVRVIEVPTDPLGYLDALAECAVAPGHGIGRRSRVLYCRREGADNGIWLDMSQNGYEPAFGVIHRRRLYLNPDGTDLRGEDRLETRGRGRARGGTFALRFHLHPEVQASLARGGDSVLLRLPKGGGWQLRTAGAAADLEQSIYLGRGGEIRRSRQIVFSGETGADGVKVKWALRRIERKRA